MGQTPEVEKAHVWLAGGFLVGGARNLFVEVGGTVQVVAEWDRHHTALRWSGLFDATSAGGDFVGEVALLYGRAKRRRRAYAALSAGPGLVTVDGACPGTRRRCSTLGLGVGAEAGLKGGVIGISANLVGNLNPRASYVSVGLSLMLGWMD